jgi:hypothetical protein
LQAVKGLDVTLAVPFFAYERVFVPSICYLQRKIKKSLSIERARKDLIFPGNSIAGLFRTSLSWDFPGDLLPLISVIEAT